MDSTTVLIPGRLAFLCASPTIIQKVKESDFGKSVHMISSDLHRQYSPLALDFGPVNLGVVNRFCAAFSKRLAKQVSHSRLLVYCFEETLEAQANACFLLASLLVLDCDWTAEEAAEPFTGPSSPFTLRPFRDATFSENPYPLLLLDCLKGLSKAPGQRGAGVCGPASRRRCCVWWRRDPAAAGCEVQGSDTASETQLGGGGGTSAASLTRSPCRQRHSALGKERGGG